MKSKKIVAMLLAGGQGSRLYVLTQGTAKPAVPYGGKYRIIDFSLSNCTNSDIDTVGVLTQYRPLELNRYIGNGAPWDLNRNHGGVYVLPPYSTGETGEWYLGTANAISQNTDFIDQYNPKYVLILSGDHIYKMDYSKMLAAHEQKKADATIAVLPVPIEEASRFGIMETDEEDRVITFAEKPKEPKSNKASMGIYIFTWDVLKKYLLADNVRIGSSHDFGKDIIPAMLSEGQNMFAYAFKGYWKDVGTIESLWQSNMDLLEDPPVFQLNDPSWRIYSRNTAMPPHYVSFEGMVSQSMISEGAIIYGDVEHSIIFGGVVIERDAVVRDSIIMSNTHILEGATVHKAIVGEGCVIGQNCALGVDEGQAYPSGCDICVVGEDTSIPKEASVPKGAMVHKNTLF